MISPKYSSGWYCWQLSSFLMISMIKLFMKSLAMSSLQKVRTYRTHLTSRDYSRKLLRVGSMSLKSGNISKRDCQIWKYLAYPPPLLLLELILG
jgi:hypothetical protein